MTGWLRARRAWCVVHGARGRTMPRQPPRTTHHSPVLLNPRRDLCSALALFAPADADPGRGLVIFLFQMVAILAIFYFLVLRPRAQQEKRHKERLQQLKRGDEVVTVGGVIGEVVHIRDDRITVRSGEARLVVQRDRIAEVRAAKAAAEEQKA